MTISDKNERNKCAETIVKVMDLINPNSKKNSNAEEYQKSYGHNCLLFQIFNLMLTRPTEHQK